MNDRMNTDSDLPTATPMPYATMGAGSLVSMLWKLGDERSGWRYRFNLFRLSPRSGSVTQQFRPQDLGEFAKLLQVLTFTLADDGCLSEELRNDLLCLNIRLDEALGPADGGRGHVLTHSEALALARVVTRLCEAQANSFGNDAAYLPSMADLLRLRRWLEANQIDQQTGG
jgi:hypothetical protein